MNIHRNKSIAFAVGMVWSFLAAASANADDTELFVGNASASAQAKPNILFILDDSISMGADVITQNNYDPLTTYPSAGCSTSRVYWSTSGALPNCGTNNYFNLTALKCQRAITAFNTALGGRYTDNMAQYDTGSQQRWEQISSSQKDRLVECQDDRPDAAAGWAGHGDGSSTTKVYARNGDTSNRWTSDPTQEIAWGSDPANNTYTLFSGNYMNWAHGTATTASRLQVMKDVTNNLLNSINGVDVGLMHFAYNEGGLVSHAMQDVATARATMQTAVNALTASNFTPLEETLYEAYLYMTGGNVNFGTASVPASREPANLAQYNSPIDLTCQKNHIVVLTDGEPRSDQSASASIRGLTDFAGTSFATHTGSTTCDLETYPAGFVTGEGGDCLDELAEFMFKGDMSPLPGKQNITTHTVGFLVDLPVLEQTAQRGGGNYYTATDTASLTTALTTIITNVLETQSTFVSPAVSVNAFNQTRNLDDLYFSVFRPSGTAHWPGNLKKYRLRSDSTVVDVNGNPAIDSNTGFFADTAQSYWSATVDGADVDAGGAANLVPSARNVYTYLGASSLTAPSNRVAKSNAVIDDAMLNTGNVGDPTRDEVVDFINGFDMSDVDQDNVLLEARHQMGDPLHARPISVIYGPTNDDARLYFATNDGYLHSIDSKTGVEQWAFLPEEFLANQVEFFRDNQSSVGTKYYGIDGSLRVQSSGDNDGIVEAAAGEKVYLYFGMRRGGDVYYALDITDPDQPSVMWRRDSSDLPGLGQSWSSAMPTKINIQGATQNADKLVLVIGGGYDATQDAPISSTDSVGNSIYFVDSLSGNLLWRGSKAGATKNFALAGKSMDYSIPSDVRVLDFNADGFADRMYAADMGGQVWRFDIFNGQPAASLVNGGVIAQLGAAGAALPTLDDTRRFYYAPDVAYVSERDYGFLHVGIGSGYRAHPNESANHNRFYALRDYRTFSPMTQAEYDALTPTRDADLVDVTTDTSALVPQGSPGWRFELSDGGWLGEKVLAETRTFNNKVYVTTFRPGSSGSGCQPALGTNRQYVMSLFNGSPIRRDEWVGPPPPETIFIFDPECDGDCDNDPVPPPPDPNDPPGGSGISSGVGTGFQSEDDLGFPVRTFWAEENIE